MTTQHNNRDLIRNALYVFQKKTGITEVNGFPKLTQAFTSFTRERGVNFCFLDYREAEKFISDLLAQAAIKSAVEDISKEWEQYTKSVIKR